MTKKYTLVILLVIFLLVSYGCVRSGYSARVQAPVQPHVQATVQQPHPHEKQGPPPWAPAHGHRAKHVYRYYPSNSIYFDTGRGLYFFYRNGSWTVSASLPGGVRISVNDFVTLEMETDKPYKYHNDVQKKYPPGQVKKKKIEKSNEKSKKKNKDKHNRD